MSRASTTLIRVALAVAIIVPIAAAATSPLLAWRDPIYIIAGFSGVVAMALLLIQPLLAGGYLRVPRAQQIHRTIGALLVIMIAVHVGGLWITSPPDVVDALLFRSATQFSAWGVVAMWAIFATALLAIMRRRMRPRSWRLGHTSLALIIVAGSTVHAMLIDGTMEPWSKTAICLLVIAATLKVVSDKRVFARLSLSRHTSGRRY